MRNMSQRSGQSGHEFWAPTPTTISSMNYTKEMDSTERPRGELAVVNGDEHAGAVEIDGKEWDGFSGTQPAELSGKEQLSPVSELSAEGRITEKKRTSGGSWRGNFDEKKRLSGAS
jgi:hypothetical protein